MKRNIFLLVAISACGAKDKPAAGPAPAPANEVTEAPAPAAEVAAPAAATRPAPEPQRARPGETVLICDKTTTHTITTNNGRYYVTGGCTSVVVSGSDNQIEISYAETVTISGANNQVIIGKAGTITTTGSNNDVGYAFGVTLDPVKIVTTGKNNKVTSGISSSF